MALYKELKFQYLGFLFFTPKQVGSAKTITSVLKQGFGLNFFTTYAQR